MFGVPCHHWHCNPNTHDNTQTKTNLEMLVKLAQDLGSITGAVNMINIVLLTTKTRDPGSPADYSVEPNNPDRAKADCPKNIQH